MSNTYLNDMHVQLTYHEHVAASQMLTVSSVKVDVT